MKLQKKIENAIRMYEKVLYVEKNVNELNIRKAIRCIMRNNPDIFWFANEYKFEPENCKLSFKYHYSKDRIELIQRSIDGVVINDFHINMVSSLSSFEQVAYVYKWLLKYCNYNLNSAYNQSIDSVLCDVIQYVQDMPKPRSFCWVF